jgi:hypothetical protein
LTGHLLTGRKSVSRCQHLARAYRDHAPACAITREKTLHAAWVGDADLARFLRFWVTMASFIKLYDSILESTVWVGQKPHVKLAWITILAKTNRLGQVTTPVPVLAALAGVSLEEFQEALGIFLNPDQFSRSPEHDGRRLAPIQGKHVSGFQVLNYEHYRDSKPLETRKEQNREAQRRHRERARACQQSADCHADVSAVSMTVSKRKAGQPKQKQKQKQKQIQNNTYVRRNPIDADRGPVGDHRPKPRQPRQGSADQEVSPESHAPPEPTPVAPPEAATAGAAPSGERPVQGEHPAVAGDADGAPAPSVGVVFEHWLRVLWAQSGAKRAAKLTPRRRSILQARLRDYSVDELCQVLDRAAKSPFHVGQNDSGRFFGDLDHLMGSAEKVDKWLASSVKPSPRPNGKVGQPTPQPAGEHRPRFQQREL